MPRPPKLWVCTLSLGLCLLGAGCHRPSFDDIRAKHRKAIEAKLAQAAKIGALLEAQPLLEGDDAQLGAQVTKIPLPAGSDYNNHEAGVMYREAFVDLARHGPTFSRLPGTNPLAACAALLREGRCPPGATSNECSCYPPAAEERFRVCAALRYLVVVRTVAFALPTGVSRLRREAGPPDSALRRTDAGPPRDAGPRRDTSPAAADGGVRRGDGGTRDAGRRPDIELPDEWVFQGGQLRAEVHVYELATGQRLGGFRYRAESPPATRRTHYARGQQLYVQQWAVEEFTTACQDTLRNLLSQRIANILY